MNKMQDTLYATHKGGKVDLKQLFKIFKRWFWLGILGLVLGAAAGVFISRIQTPVYEASARVLVMRAPDQGTAA